MYRKGLSADLNGTRMTISEPNRLSMFVATAADGAVVNSGSSKFETTFESRRNAY